MGGEPAPGARRRASPRAVTGEHPPGPVRAVGCRREADELRAAPAGRRTRARHVPSRPGRRRTLGLCAPPLPPGDQARTAPAGRHLPLHRGHRVPRHGWTPRRRAYDGSRASPPHDPLPDAPRPGGGRKPPPPPCPAGAARHDAHHWQGATGPGGRAPPRRERSGPGRGGRKAHRGADQGADRRLRLATRAHPRDRGAHRPGPRPARAHRPGLIEARRRRLDRAAVGRACSRPRNGRRCTAGPAASASPAASPSPKCRSAPWTPCSVWWPSIRGRRSSPCRTRTPSRPSSPLRPASRST